MRPLKQFELRHRFCALIEAVNCLESIDQQIIRRLAVPCGHFKGSFIEYK
jgi:hypothetical protein